MIKQIPKMDGIKAAHLFSLLDTNSELLKLHALRAALIVEPKNRFILRSLFATIAMATELTPSTKIEFTLTFINDCDNDDIARRTTQEMGQLALKHGMYSEAETLFQICLSKISEENVEEYLKVSFSKSQSVYENNNHIYSEMDLPELEKLTQLCGNETRILFRKKSFCIHIKKKQQLSWIFLAKALINLSKWDDLRRVIERAPSVEMLFLVFGSPVNVLPDIYTMCLRKLFDFIPDANIDHFAILFRNTVETALTVDPSSATPYFHHVHPVVKFSEYPSGEALWLHNACVSAANRMQNMKYQGKAREWRELADSFIQCIHPNDRQVQ